MNFWLDTKDLIRAVLCILLRYKPNSTSRHLVSKQPIGRHFNCKNSKTVSDLSHQVSTMNSCLVIVLLVNFSTETTCPKTRKHRSISNDVTGFSCADLIKRLMIEINLISTLDVVGLLLLRPHWAPTDSLIVFCHMKNKSTVSSNSASSGFLRMQTDSNGPLND